MVKDAGPSGVVKDEDEAALPEVKDGGETGPSAKAENSGADDDDGAPSKKPKLQ